MMCPGPQSVPHEGHAIHRSAGIESEPHASLDASQDSDPDDAGLDAGQDVCPSDGPTGLHHPCHAIFESRDARQRVLTNGD